MTEDTSRAALWNHSPTARVRNGVQRSVTALLDELAPERVLGKVKAEPGAVSLHRTPTGCVLQAPDCALSVSWFSDGGRTNDLGELNIVVWRGTVTRRGSRPPAAGATTVSELTLRPVDPTIDTCDWIDGDGTRYDTAGVAAKCVALLDEQMRSA